MSDESEPCRGEPLVKDGQVIAILRPDDPEKALAEASRIEKSARLEEISHSEAERQFHAILTSQKYRYMGIACVDGKHLLNHDHTIIKGDHMRPGDSMAPYEQVMATFR